MTSAWTINVAGRLYGPYSSERLRSFASEGRLAPTSLIVGVPGRVVRSLSEQDVPMLLLNAEIYHDRWQRYRMELKEL